MPVKTKSKSRSNGNGHKPVEFASAKPNGRIGIRFFEAGSSGLNAYSGFVSEAYNTALTYPGCWPLFQRIWQSMPEMAMVRNAFSTWGRRSSLRVELPDMDKPTDDDKKAQDFFYEAFDDIEGGLDQLIQTYVMQTPFFGWSWSEVPPALQDPNWKPPADIDGEPDPWRSQYDDGLIGIRRFSHRSQSTFFGWDMTTKGKKLKGLTQQDFPNPPVTLKLSDSLHLRVGDFSNPEGLPGLIPVWRLSRLKEGYETVLGIGSEHTAGHFKVVKTEQGVLSETDRGDVETAARNTLSAQEGGYLYLPYGLDGAIIDVPFSAAGTILETIRHYSLLSLSVFMMQFIGLNTMTSTGALASSSDSSSMSVLAFNGVLDNGADELDEQIGKRLWDWNKDAFPKATGRPRLKWTHIEKDIGLGELGTFLTQADGIIQWGADDIREVRKRTGFLPETESADAMAEAEEARRMDNKRPVEEVDEPPKQSAEE